jgi:hypothetical protein
MSVDSVLPFRTVADTGSGSTGFAGLFLYQELACALDLPKSLDRHLRLAGEQGWLDRQQALTVLLINWAGGDCVDDVERLEADAGLGAVMRQAEGHRLSNYQRKQLEGRFRKGRERTFPAPTRLHEWLARFHDPAQEARRESGRAFIPAPSAALRGLGAVNQELCAAVQRAAPQRTATLDVDATLAETGKREALYCYKGFKAYQPLTVYWAEQGLVVRSEFRDGNVPAGYALRRVLEEAVGSLPAGVEQVYLRSDSAGYQHEVMRYCREAGIGFSISADVTPAFKGTVAEVPEGEWHPLGRSKPGPEYTEVPFVPDGAGFSLKEATFRYVAVRERLEQAVLPGTEEQLRLPFATVECGGQVYKVTGLVTNRELPARELIAWHRERCGKSEEAHAVMKTDLSGGQLPSGKFGANAAWWGLMVLAYNVHAAMGRVVLGDAWANRRMKAMRFHLMGLPGRLVERGRQLWIKLEAGVAEWLGELRRKIRGLARAPA